MSTDTPTAIEAPPEGRADPVERALRTLDQAGDVVFGLDGAGIVRHVSREAEAIVGAARGRRLRELLNGGEEELDRALAGVLDDETVEAVRCSLRSQSGETRELMAHLCGVGRDGAEVVAILFGRDVTREAALAARLRQSERLAAVGSLAAGLAHEIRNPLNGAVLHLTFLERALKRAQHGDGNTDVLEAIQVVSSEIKRLSALVTDFLCFARPDELRPRSTNMAELCRRVVASIGESRASTELVVEADPALVAEVDADKIEQMLANLVRNAVEAVAPAGGGKVALRAFARGENVVLEVHDDGPGLPSPDAPVFDAFYSTKPGGTGLGLAIVHRIVSDHAGAVLFDSQPGATVFRVTLPARAASR